MSASSNTAPSEVLPVWARGPHGLHLAEVPTKAGGRLPTFFVIGAAKCGTTALNGYLEQHPDIAMCPYKEPHFFSTDVLYARGLPWYEGLFADCRRAEVCGEASTSYARAPEFPATAARIHAVVPDARLIYLVREPVSRTESDALQAIKYMRHVIGEASPTDDLDELVERHPVAVHSSEYIVQVRAYLDLFERSQLLVILQDDLRADPAGTLASIFTFIGVDPKVPIETGLRVNVTSDFIDGVRDARFLAWLSRMPGYETIRGLIPRALKSGLKAVARGVSTPPPALELSPATRARMGKHFRPFNAELAEFLGRDLSGWDRPAP